jgi:hypothetical protein
MTNELKELARTKFEREFNPSETLSVLKYNPPIFWSWGATEFTNFEDRALMFKVSGNHHKGYVLITLAYDDTYKVYIVSNKAEVLKEFTMVYFDDLTELIDNQIERVAEYKH